MTPAFLNAFERLIGHEGGFQIMPQDDGNWTGGRQGRGVLKGTKYGVSASSYPHVDIAALTLEQAQAIYWDDFWLATGCDRLSGELAFQVFDGAVHSGPSNAIRFMQRALGVADDGVWGRYTEAAFVRALADSPQALVGRYNGHRLHFLTTTRRWDDFDRGWARRIAANLIAIY
jgi:lysozyme family protein